MGRKVTQDDIDKWVELRKRGYSFKQIGEETKWGGETVRAHISRGGGIQGKEKTELEGGKQETELSIQAKAFKEFEAGKNWKDLVKDEICTISKAKELQKSWEGGEVGGEDIGDRLTELRESVFEEIRTVSGGTVRFPRQYRKIVSTETRAQRGGHSASGRTYCFGCYKVLVFANPNTPVSGTIKSLKMIINYLVERSKKGKPEENR